MISDFNKKQKTSFSANKIAFQIAGVLFLIIIVVLFIADIRIYQKKKELTLQIESYKKQIEQIKKSSQTLKDEIANSNNQDYIEKIAYEQLGEQKPGENQVIFITPPKKTEASQQAKSFWSLKSWSGWLSGGWAWIKSKF
jgi:cell division protein FtsB